MTSRRPQPAVVLAPALALPAAQALSGLVLCSASLLSAPVLRVDLPKLPKISLPKISLPKISLPKLPNLPGQGKTEAEAKAAPPKGKAPGPVAGGVQVRVGAGPKAAADAPSFSDLSGRAGVTVATPGSGWTRFPKKRMPGANLDAWKKMAQEIGPQK